MIPLPTFSLVGLVIGLNIAALFFAVLGERMDSDNLRILSFTLTFLSLLLMVTSVRWLMWL